MAAVELSEAETRVVPAVPHYPASAGPGSAQVRVPERWQPEA